MKNPNHDPNKVIELLKQLEVQTGQPQYDLDRRQDLHIQIRVDESVGPAMFKSDPLIPGGYVANSLTIRAMRPDIFVLGDTESIDELRAPYHCACGKESDVQFWKVCPYCGREYRL